MKEEVKELKKKEAKRVTQLKKSRLRFRIKVGRLESKAKKDKIGHDEFKVVSTKLIKEA